MTHDYCLSKFARNMKSPKTLFNLAVKMSDCLIQKFLSYLMKQLKLSPCKWKIFSSSVSISKQIPIKRTLMRQQEKINFIQIKRTTVVN